MRVYVCLLCLAAFATGCGGPKIVPVSGRISLANKPLPNASIVFQPISEQHNPGPGSHAKTDKDGKFALKLLTGQGNGALVGLHKVIITAYEGDDIAVPSSGSNMAFRKALLPDEYNAKSKLKFDVPATGTSEANFDLPK